MSEAKDRTGNHKPIRERISDILENPKIENEELITKSKGNK
jgi:hypothetical protein